ncbi:hypothetical protein EXN66_Car020621 [Channa argus]|uniref:Uncharacterized protein n=1 Tax=Channa argus TaxID=215402 RepID=A0A6G1QQD5_CHAAH|nr:hypothetical protein EXN66_Car020621 [Channa argus]
MSFLTQPSPISTGLRQALQGDGDGNMLSRDRTTDPVVRGRLPYLLSTHTLTHTNTLYYLIHTVLLLPTKTCPELILLDNFGI